MMDIRKITFLCLIFLFVIVISNYISVEGFETKKQRDARKKREKDNKARAKAATKATNAKAKAAANAAAEVKRMDEIKKLIATQTATGAVPGMSAAEKKILEDTIKNANSINTQIQKTAADVKTTADNAIKLASTVEKSATNAKSSESTVKGIESNISSRITDITSKMNNMTANSNGVEQAANKAIANISGYAATVKQNMEASQNTKTEMDAKIATVGKQVDNVKSYVDNAEKIKVQMEEALKEFQKNSQVVLSQMKLASDNYKATVLTASNKTSGFQNMEVNPNTSTKTSGFVTVESAYNGQMNLEGFSTVVSTESSSAYLPSPSLFALERNLIAALKTFNEKYYAYYSCIQKQSTTLSDANRRNNCKFATATQGGLDAVVAAKGEALSAITEFNTAITAMGAKTPLGRNEIANGKKMTQKEFEDRHNEIKATAIKVSELRSELDMKMANLLDKTRGPLPEARNKHDSQNYVAIGLTILATSMVYYVFVEMK